MPPLLGSFFNFGYVRLADPLLRAMRRALVDLAGLEPGQSVLDVCCGTGAQVYEYARSGFQATGLELDPGMLRQASWYHGRFSGLDPALVLGDAASMPFADGAFDLASISLALHEKDNDLQDAIMREMRRVVKSSGKFLLADFRVPLPRSLAGCGVRLIESSAGDRHHHNFRRYLQQGGLPTITRRHSLNVERMGRAVGGAVQLLLVRPCRLPLTPVSVV